MIAYGDKDRPITISSSNNDGLAEPYHSFKNVSRFPNVQKLSSDNKDVLIRL